MEDLSNSQVIAIIAALVGSIYLLGRVIEVLAKVIWSKRFNGAGKKDENCEQLKSQVKEMHGIISRLDESGTPLVYSHDLFITQKEIIRDQKEIISTQKDIVDKLVEVSVVNQSTLAGLKEVSNLNKATLESQKELFSLLVEKKVRG